MKSVPLSLAVLVFFFAALAHAQNDSSSIKWTRIEANEDGFSVEAPDSFNYRRNLALGRFDEGRGQYLSDDLYLYAFVNRAKNARQYEIVDGFVKANRQSGSVQNVGGHQIIRYEFEGSDRYFHTVVLGKSENRSYAFHAVSRTARNPLAARFIKSIRFGRAAIDQQTEPESDPAPQTGTAANDLKLDLETVSPGPVSRLDAGYGSGTGVGPGSGTPKAERVPLKIISKQKAEYTDLARFYNIMGTVTLRVTFMADNTIGSIIPIKTLPFGLTGSSIAAARSMRFQAEIANGQPRTTSRPVEFLFTIF